VTILLFLNFNSAIDFVIVLQKYGAGALIVQTFPARGPYSDEVA
jgi:hypothetical protein